MWLRGEMFRFVIGRLQVSDQLVEINGNSTAGMTHSQAVEQIRRGGHRIHLVLKRGNGYVPDYGEKIPVSRSVVNKPPSLFPLIEWFCINVWSHLFFDFGPNTN